MLEEQGSWDPLPVQDMASTLRTNFESSVHLSCLAHPLLKASAEGSLVFISSIAGSQTVGPTIAIYHCSKGALNQLTKNLALEWAKDGIRVNTVAPGYTQTDMVSLVTNEVLDAAKMRIPMRRFGEVHEIVAAVAFLCMPCSSFTTGTILRVDGGMTCLNSIAACADIERS
ncbi:hypothetical protein GOP47_0020984 [Adiantum capillus-veneris]|uniref:Uncharacterized protein n=1 Tax=Adiantum capillus-veneris TaxID=13818 RepID=A0A9D4Z7G9_ADICA|nr:hypothetical protein GOP47_0020984 [Adiantum capillus-veneris]